MEAQGIAKETLAKRIAGEIVLSMEAGKTIQKWRNIFKIPQRRLADQMNVMPSVVSDYESGRRKSPGIKVVKRIVDGLIAIDEKAGGNVIRSFSSFPVTAMLSDAVMDLKEFTTPMSVRDFCKLADATIIVREDLADNKLYGYTIIDSEKAIIELPPLELVKLYGLTTERALIFAGAHHGKSCMVALKVTNLRPGLVILYGSEEVDDLAKRISEIESVPLAICKTKNVKELINNLKKRFP